MRLSCPNCDAQYEVAEDAIPAGGRDVQCSNCGHAWFQMSPDAEMADETDAEMAEEAELTGLRPAPVATGAIAPEPDDEDEDEEAGSPFDQRPPLKQRSVDDNVLAVLREEAERETSARRRDADAALAASAAAATAATRPVEAATVPPEVAPVAPMALPADPVHDDGLAGGAGMVLARSAKGRELLPDIDAIKSTLRAGEDRSADPDDDAFPQQPMATQRSGSFRGGFLLTTGIGILLAVLYVAAPGMATRFPATAPVLGAYVAGVDDARLWLDGLARKAVDRLRDRNSEATGSN